MDHTLTRDAKKALATIYKAYNELPAPENYVRIEMPIKKERLCSS